MNTDDRSRELERLERSWTDIQESPEKPRSTMAVVEYGLGERRRAEVYVNRLLCYFLDPETPHGMGTDFLATLLEALPDSLGFDEDTNDLWDVDADEQVQAVDGDSSTYPDLVLDVPEEWFLLIELKFAAEETGTEAYARASRIGDEPVADYESGRYYLYLHRDDEPTASSDAFANWTWRSFVNEVIDPILTGAAPRYPQRTTTQLHELRDDIAHLSTMSDDRTADEAKLDLYIEHADAIEDVRSSFDDAWTAYAERWGRRLADHLRQEGTVDVPDRLDGQVPEAVVSRSDRDERWLFLDEGGDWQHLHQHGWYRDEETLEPLERRASDNDDLRIGFYHRMGRHRDAAVQDHVLHFKFRNMGSNPGEFKDVYSRAFDEREGHIEDLLAGTAGELTGNKLTKITATYDVPVGSSEDFFEAYTEALHEAFVDLVADSPELVEVLGRTFDEAVEAYGE